MSTQLEQQGIQLMNGYRAENLDCQPDLVVIGNALSRGNPEVEAVLNRGLHYISARNGWPNMCYRIAGYWQWPEPTVKPPPPAC